MIYAGQFYNIDVNSNGIVDALWCQGGNSGSDIGLWCYPNSTKYLCLLETLLKVMHQVQYFLRGSQVRLH